MIFGSNLYGEGEITAICNSDCANDGGFDSVLAFSRGKYNIRKIRFRHQVFTTSSFFYVRLKS